jgi:hypothetical protein
MAVGVLMQFSGGSNEAYDRVIERMGLTDGSMPDGGLFHIAGEVDGGYRVVDVWETPEAFQKFAEEQIGPITAAEGFPQPEVTLWPIHNVLSRTPTGIV